MKKQLLIIGEKTEVENFVDKINEVSDEFDVDIIED